MSKTIENIILNLINAGCKVRAWGQSTNEVVLRVVKNNIEKWLYIKNGEIVATL